MSNLMDSFLAGVYGNTPAAANAQEDLEKEASVQLFMKLAGEQNIDLKTMSDEQVTALYNGWVEKSAEFPFQKKDGDDKDKDGKDDDKDKHEKAEKEHEEKKAAAEKAAEADALGRIMAHAYIQELQKIAASNTEKAGTKEAGAMPDALRKGIEAARSAKTASAPVVSAPPTKTAAPVATRAKKASAIDELARERAVIVAHEAGFDAEDAGRKVAAVLELNLVKESTKVASAPDADTAIGIRALEFLEAAGYPVNWEPPAQQ